MAQMMKRTNKIKLTDTQQTMLTHNAAALREAEGLLDTHRRYQEALLALIADAHGVTFSGPVNINNDILSWETEADKK